MNILIFMYSKLCRYKLPKVRELELKKNNKVEIKGRRKENKEKIGGHQRRGLWWGIHSMVPPRSSFKKGLAFAVERGQVYPKTHQCSKSLAFQPNSRCL